MKFGRFYLRALSSRASRDRIMAFIAAGHRNFIERESQARPRFLPLPLPPCTAAQLIVSSSRVRARACRAPPPPPPPPPPPQISRFRRCRYLRRYRVAAPLIRGTRRESDIARCLN
jgi:hypothetical protein